ncbi:EamA family transporter RarD [Peribacillus glennii]|uniref:EamA family transporter RarD n=1 Tax=Peribacillus glennii TaxID=2303991 RepID=A0A372LIK4_9BACI|nr:EamA family transporter RarD [Peribacillus glennii]RFU66227.1 EamA family transporter RarD [Peribacillus glennii]
MNLTTEKEGAFYAALSYIIWGVIPIYWKWLQGVQANEILAHRVLWSFVFMIGLLLATKKWKAFVSYVREIAGNPKKFFALLAASVLVSANWGIFIWAVNSGYILQTSLGYYINPLVSVLLGVLVLKEKLSGAQLLSFALAAVGVLILGIHFGGIPWVSLSLAITFGLYGLVKKVINAEAAIGLTLETMMVTPIAVGYWVYLLFTSDSKFFVAPDITLLLLGGGIATALPLLYFAKGAQKVPLSMLGFLQYIAPTITLFLGVFLYHEAFTRTHMLAFTFIWGALSIYSISMTKWGTAGVQRMKNRLKMGA